METNAAKAAVMRWELFGFLMGRMQPTEAAVLFEFKFLRGTLLVLRGCIITLFAGRAGERDDVAHGNSFEV